MRNINTIYIYRLIFGLMVVLILGALVVGLYAYSTRSFGSFWEYSSFEISDWLINYQGGFVRRGLIGQLLYIGYQIHPYPVRDIIVILYITGFIFITGLLVYVMKKEGLSVFILPFTICLYYAFTCDLLWTRRDYWSLILAIIIYYHFFRFVKMSSFNHLILFFFFSALTMLMHEAAFFYTFPILMIYSLCAYMNKKALKSVSILYIWIPVIVLFMYTVLHKGDANTMALIWQSWEPCFHDYPAGSGSTPNIGHGVNFLSRTSLDAIFLHIRLVWLARFAPYIPSFPFNMYIIVAVYYLVTRINTLDLKFYKLWPVSNLLISNIVLIQFIFLFPMFGFLSCDLGRVVPYWVISSLLFYHIVNREKISFVVPSFVNKCSVLFQNKIDGYKSLNKKWVYCLIIVTLPLNCYYGASYGGIIPIQYFLKVLKYLYN